MIMPFAKELETLMDVFMLFEPQSSILLVTRIKQNLPVAVIASSYYMQVVTRFAVATKPASHLSNVIRISFQTVDAMSYLLFILHSSVLIRRLHLFLHFRLFP